MQPLTKKLNHVLTLMLTIAALMVGQSSVWAASTFTISASHNSSTKETTFTITRTTNTSTSEKVLYHTVGLSAIEGQHFARVYGELSFDISHNERSITINEITPNVNAYLYQNGTTRQYRFEVLDRGGFHLAHYDRTITTGSNVSGSAFDIKDVTVNSGTITVQDKDYKQAYHEIPVATYFSNSAPKDYFVLADAELRMTLTFQAKEKDDGYQHLQLLVNHPEPTDNQKNWDEGAGDNNPGTMEYSSYMATFCHQGSSENKTYANYSFPVTSVGNKTYDKNNLLYAWTSLGNSVGDLRNQQFNTNCRATDDGRLIISTKANLSNFSTLGIRFDASGDHDDTWYAYNTVAHIQAVDATRPTVLGFTVPWGMDAKGTTVYVNVAFSEIVIGTSSKLTSSWGDLSYVAGSGSNVLTFCRTIPENATSALNITGYSGITDLAGNAPSSVSANSICTVLSSYNYSITYDLAGGTVSTSNPTGYKWETATFTLKKPIRAGYTFAGWTGSNGNTPQTTVTIPAGSHGDKTFIAKWTPLWGQDNGKTGEDEDHAYVISSTAGLDMLAKVVNGTDGYTANTFEGKYFKLGNDITYTPNTDWDDATIKGTA